MKSERRATPRPEPQFYYAVSGALMLGAPFWRELYVSHYPFGRLEAWVLPLIAGIIGAAIALLSRKGGRVFATLTFGALLFVFADLQLAPEGWTYLGVTVGGCLLLSALLEHHRAFITSLALAAFYVSSLWRPPIGNEPKLAATSVARSENPVLIHVILDAQWGIGGMQAGGDSATAAVLRDFYLQRDFQLFEGAYSRFRSTREAIPNAFSLGLGRKFDSAPAEEKYEPDLRTIPYFTYLRQHGYDIHVLQSTYVDFCQSGDVTSCSSEPFNSLRNTGSLDGPWFMRGRWVLRYFLQTQSRLYRRLYGPPDTWSYSVAGAGVRSLRELGTAIDVLSEGSYGDVGGHAFIAHLLLPHGPMDVDSSCRLLADDSQRVPFRFKSVPSNKRWKEIVGVGGGQSRCAHLMLGELLDRIDGTIGRDRSIVIVHGDHGWRLQREEDGRKKTLDELTLDELNASFSTLFAIRRPGVPASVSTAAVPIQDLLWNLVTTDFKGPTKTTWEQFVMRYPPEAGARLQLRELSADEMPWAHQSQEH